MRKPWTKTFVGPLAGLAPDDVALVVHLAGAAAQALVQHLRAARGEVGDLADEVGVDALHEVAEVEVDVGHKELDLTEQLSTQHNVYKLRE